MGLKLYTNLAELPPRIFKNLANELAKNNLWVKMVDFDHDPIYFMNQDDIDTFSKRENGTEQVLRRWGNRGQTVFDMIARMQTLSEVYDNEFDTSQLQVYRKFKVLRWINDEQVTMSIDEGNIKLECRARGFPCPEVKWYKNSTTEPVHTGRTLVIMKCKCSTEHQYKCVAINEVAEGFGYSDHYRSGGKQFRSQLESDFVDVTSCVRDDELCDSCKNFEMGRLSQILADDDIEKQLPPPIPPHPSLDITLRAADKVALIMSNCSYQHLPELITPHCDAQTLADALQKMNYKTVTLADLTLDEMRYFIREYRKLIGNGVYAVFYFVGHGFEVNGQCYLLGVDAPEDAHQPQHSLSMDWLLSIFRNIQPSLNLLLLDVCRKFVPYDAIAAFVEYSDQFKRYHVAHRNMVYGYSTSGGVGAYEVKGEVNGVFMKYLKNHVQLEISVIDMLNRVMIDIGDDQKVCDVQVPEIRSTLTHPRSLADPLIFDGHTVSFDNHTIHWRLMHELPNPATVRFETHSLVATVWFQFCGNFTNKVYVLASISDLRISPDDDEFAEEIDEEPSEHALTHRAHVEFPGELHCSDAKEHADDEEGVSLYWILSGLQKIKGESGLKCEVHLRHVDDPETTIEKKNVDIGHILITRIRCLL